MSSCVYIVLSSWRRWAMFILVVVGLFALFVFVPVWTTPGNDFLFQLSITPPSVFLLMVSLSIGNALIILMQWHLRQSQEVKIGAKEISGGVGLLAASIFSTLVCVACFSSLLSLFGLGGVIFFGEHQLLIALIALCLMFFALWYTARRVNGVCTRCVV